MTKEQVEQFDKFQRRLNEIEMRLGWMEKWGEVLYQKSSDDVFLLDIRTMYGTTVLQRSIGREGVEMEYNAELLRLQSERDEINKAIAEL